MSFMIGILNAGLRISLVSKVWRFVKKAGVDLQFIDEHDFVIHVEGVVKS